MFRHKILKRKKGQISQVMLMMVMILAIAITILLVKYVVSNFYDALDEGGISTTEMNNTRDIINQQFQMFDYGTLLLTICLIIGLMITSFLIPTHPIFLVVNVIGIFFLVFIGMIMTNVYGEIVSGAGADTLGDTADDMPMTNFLLQYLPFIGALTIFITSVIMFARGS